MLPVFIVCKILAITPYSIEGPPEMRRPVVTTQDLFINIVKLVLFAGYYVYMEINNLLIINRFNLLHIITRTAQHYAIVLSAIYCLTFFHIHRKHLFNFLTSLTDIDKELEQMNITVDYKIVRRFCWLQMTIRIILFSIILMFHYTDLGIKLTIKLMILHELLLVITTMSPCYVFALLFDIRYKYSLINNKLKHMFLYETHINELAGSSTERNKIVILRNLINIHGRLCDLCKTMNAMYNAHLVLILLSCFISIVVTGYDVTNAIDRQDFRILLMANKFYWTFYNIAQVLILIYNVQACCLQVRISNMHHVIFVPLEYYPISPKHSIAIVFFL